MPKCKEQKKHMLCVLSTKAPCINVNICEDFPEFHSLHWDFAWFAPLSWLTVTTAEAAVAMEAAAATAVAPLLSLL